MSIFEDCDENVEEGNTTNEYNCLIESLNAGSLISDVIFTQPKAESVIGNVGLFVCLSICLYVTPRRKLKMNKCHKIEYV